MGNAESVPRPKMVQVDAQLAQDQAVYGRLYRCLQSHPHVIIGSRPLKLMLGEKWESNKLDVALAATTAGEFNERVYAMRVCIAKAYGVNPDTIEQPDWLLTSRGNTAVSVLGRNTGLATLRLPRAASNPDVQFVGVVAADTNELRSIIHRDAHPPANITMEVGVDGRRAFGVPPNALSAIFDRHVRQSDCHGVEMRTGRKAKYAARGFALDEQIKETGLPSSDTP